MKYNGNKNSDNRQQSSNLEEDIRLYKETGSTSARDRILANLKPIINAIAKKQIYHCPRELTVEDLAQEAYFGVIDALQKYNPKHGDFKNYVRSRVRGTMQDLVRKQSWLTRRTTEKKQRYFEKSRKFFEEHGRSPSEEELRDELEIEDDSTMTEYTLAATINNPTSLSDITLDARMTRPDLDTARTRYKREEAPLEAVARLELQEKTLRAPQISSDQRTSVLLYFFGGLNMEEIGKEIGLSQSGASIVLKSARELLKTNPDLEQDLIDMVRDAPEQKVLLDHLRTNGYKKKLRPSRSSRYPQPRAVAIPEGQSSSFRTDSLS